MPYDSVTSRSDAAALIPEDAANEILKNATEKSFVLSTFKHRRMSRAQQRMPVLDTKPTAYFVTGDTGLKQSTEMAWSNKYLDAEEIACVVPIPENVIEDADFDLWDQYHDEIEEAIAVALDAAVLFGTGAPSSWPTNVLTAAIAAGNRVVRGTASTVDFMEDVNQVMKAVESDGYAVRNFLIRTQFKADVRGIRDANKGFLHPPTGPANTGSSKAGFQATIYSEPAFVSMLGYSGFANGSGNAELFAFDTTQFIVGIRSDIRMKKFTEGVITDAAGNIILNLMQQDAVALRITARFAWQVANPVTRLQPTAASRYPAGVMTQV